VLYVAVTRAVRRLHLVAVATRKDDGTLAAPPANSLLARLWPLVEAQFAAAVAAVAPAPTLENDDDAAHFVPQLQRLASPAIPDAWRAPAAPAVAPRAETLDALAADIGTLLHALLELVAGAPDAWPLAVIPARQAGFERWLAARGWPAAEARRGAQRAAQLLATTLESRDGQWVLRRRDDAGAELAIAKVPEGTQGAGADGTAQTRVVDRSFVEAGLRWIVDYKTADLGPQADEARLAAHAERYRAQLESYAPLFEAEALPRRLAVFYAAHGKLITLD
jgi:ATP-dependent exoDNAse (exonuclease V) beta subunit